MYVRTVRKSPTSGVERFHGEAGLIRRRKSQENEENHEEKRKEEECRRRRWKRRQERWQNQKKQREKEKKCDGSCRDQRTSGQTHWLGCDIKSQPLIMNPHFPLVFSLSTNFFF
ncbi:hypothetical protein ISN44_As09g026600 [Arabidopsis suecica]|uniref:Uncharacterized protein n=1 Tax=Arabidopsis suecica TaxID=45249 RepID=A0A8T2ANE3_ARASU|nr:hypothetical protein ISN44_As09g026600 [Arabidopsis suecica]